MAGYFISPTITFGSYILTSVGLFDIFLAKYDASGNVLWATSAGGNRYDYGESVTVDASGSSYLTGYFESHTVTFGSYTLTNTGNTNIFLTIFDASGNVLWATSAGGTDDGEGYCVAVDASENAYVTGWFSSPKITFGSDTLPNTEMNGLFDMFITKSAHGNVGINELNHSESFLVYPNPAKDKCQVQSAKCHIKSIEIFNLTGEKVYGAEFSAGAGDFIELSFDFPAGVYFVKVQTENDVEVKKLVVE